MKRPVAEIVVSPDRRRQEMGDIPGLARSLARYGLIHPIVLDDAGNLIAGGRRLEACRRLGWSEVETCSLGELSEAERAEVELEENVQRKDLTPYERSKDMLRRAAVIGPILSAKSADKPKPRGHEATYDAPKEHVAEALGTSGTSLRRAEQHVAAVVEFPDLKAQPQDVAIREARARRQAPGAGGAKRPRRTPRPRPQGPAVSLWLRTLKDFRDRWAAMGGQDGLLAALANWAPADLDGLGEELAGLSEQLHDAAHALTARREPNSDRAG